MKKTRKKVFTFLQTESLESAYLNLCLKTWEKNFSEDYEIIAINKQTLSNYISEKYFKTVKNITPEVINYIKACVLYSNGGIFMNSDTLLLKEFYLPEEMLDNYDTVVFGNSPVSACLGFMMAQKGSIVLKEYITRLEKTLQQQEQTFINTNKVFNDMLSEGYNSKVLVIDAESSGYLPEKALYGVVGENLRAQLLFSSNVDAEDIYNNTKGIVSVHCKKISEEYLNMDEDEFLSQNTLLAQILNKCLNKN